MRNKMKELFEEGILSHDEDVLGFVWREYPSRLHGQFLRLLQDSELAYEIFDGMENQETNH